MVLLFFSDLVANEEKILEGQAEFESKVYTQQSHKNSKEIVWQPIRCVFSCHHTENNVMANAD